MKKIAKRLIMLIAVSTFMVIAASVAYAEEDILETTLQVQVESDEESDLNETLEESVNTVETPTEENRDDVSNEDELIEENLENNIINDEAVPENTTDLTDNELEVTETLNDNQNNNEENPDVISDTAEDLDNKSEYMVTFESPDGKRFSIDGGSQIDLKEVLSQLWDDVPEADISVDESSIDGNCYKIENNIFSDFGPFTRADRKLVVAVADKRYELTVIDPVSVSGISDLPNNGGSGTETDPIVYELTNNTELTGTIYFQQKTSSATTTYYVFDLKSYELTRNVSCANAMISIQSNVNVVIKDGIISGNGNSITANTSAITVSNAELTLRNVTIKNCKTVYGHEGSAVSVDGDSSITMVSCGICDNSCSNTGSGSTILVIGTGNTVDVNISGTDTNPTKISDNEGIGLVVQGTVNLTIDQHTEFTGNIGYDAGAIYLLEGAKAIIDGASINNNTGTNAGGLFAYKSDVEIKNAKICNNKSDYWGGGGGIVASESTIIVNNSNIFNNEAVNWGGGIKSSESTIVINNSNIFNNETSGQAGEGGGVYVIGGTLEVKNCELYNNKAKSIGGAIHAIDCNKVSLKRSKIHGNKDAVILYIDSYNMYDGIIEIDNTDIFGNNCDNSDISGSGCIYIGRAKTITINNTRLYNNTMNNSGQYSSKIIGIGNCEMLYIRDSKIYNNIVENGCVISINSATNAVIEDSEIYGNTTFNGNGVISVYGDAAKLQNTLVEIKRTKVYDNSATVSYGTHFNGGGIFLAYANAIIDNSKIHNNTATGTGGGISIYYKSNVDIKSSDIYNNSAATGGGIYCYDATVNITDSKVHGNTAKQTGSIGGGILSQSSTLTIHSTDIYNNAAEIEGGGVCCVEGNTKITSTRIYGNIIGKDFADQSWMMHGKISGLCCGGGGVSVIYGVAEFDDVEIYENNSYELYGGGIHSVNNQTTLKNTKVTNNYSNYEGAGIYAEYDSDTQIGQSITLLEDNTNVYDNTKEGSQNNVFLTSGTVLNLKNLSKNAKIGVSTEETATYDDPVTISAGETEPFGYVFFSDNQNYYISNPRSGGKYIIKLCAYNSDNPGGYIPVIDKVDEDEEDEEEESEDTEENEEEEIVSVSTEYINSGNPNSDQMEKAKAERRAKILKAVWFTINLLCTIITVAISALTFAGKNKNSNMGLKLLSLLPAISLILMLVLSYPYGGTDTVADAYTLVFVVTTAIQCGIGYLAWKDSKIKNNIK